MAVKKWYLCKPIRSLFDWGPSPGPEIRVVPLDSIGCSSRVFRSSLTGAWNLSVPKGPYLVSYGDTHPCVGVRTCPEKREVILLPPRPWWRTLKSVAREILSSTEVEA